MNRVKFCPNDGWETKDEITHCPFCYFPLIKEDTPGNIETIEWPILVCPNDGKGYYDSTIKFCKSCNTELVPFKSS